MLNADKHGVQSGRHSDELGETFKDFSYGQCGFSVRKVTPNVHKVTQMKGRGSRGRRVRVAFPSETRSV